MFRFNWQFFNVEELKEQCKTALTASIAESSRPPVMVDPLQVVDMDFGTVPPSIAFDSVRQVSPARAHVVMKVAYSGDANITMRTRLQANPLIEHIDSCPSFVRPAMVWATESLIIPFELRLTKMKAECTMDVVYIPYGLTVSFRETPLKSFDAVSSLDSVPGVHDMLAKELEVQFAEAFSEDIPESIWKVTNRQHISPDPTLGPRRWRQHLTPKTYFRQLGLRAPHVPECRAFQTLALDAKIPYAITSRLVKIEPKKHAEVVDIRDLIAETMSPLATPDSSMTSIGTNGSPRRPRRRVVKLDQLQHALEPAKSEDKVARPPMPRRHSAPGEGQHRKMRTVSLQVGPKPSFSTFRPSQSTPFESFDSSFT